MDKYNRKALYEKLDQLGRNRQRIQILNYYIQSPEERKSSLEIMRFLEDDNTRIHHEIVRLLRT